MRESFANQTYGVLVCGVLTDDSVVSTFECYGRITFHARWLPVQNAENIQEYHMALTRAHSSAFLLATIHIQSQPDRPKLCLHAYFQLEARSIECASSLTALLTLLVWQAHQQANVWPVIGSHTGRAWHGKGMAVGTLHSWRCNELSGGVTAVLAGKLLQSSFTACLFIACCSRALQHLVNLVLLLASSLGRCDWSVQPLILQGLQLVLPVVLSSSICWLDMCAISTWAVAVVAGLLRLKNVLLFAGDSFNYSLCCQTLFGCRCSCLGFNEVLQDSNIEQCTVDNTLCCGCKPHLMLPLIRPQCNVQCISIYNEQIDCANWRCTADQS